MYPGFFGPTRSAPKAKTKSSKRITAQQLALLNKKLPPTPQSDLSFVGAGVPLARNGMLHLTLNPQLGAHRRSSIPFSDRTPQVRFIKKAEEHNVSQPGSHAPLAPSAMPKEREDIGGGSGPGGKRKSSGILKKTDFPILVDQGFVPPKIGDTKINQEMEASTVYVEKVIQNFSSAERDSRGALDILTFPVTSATNIEVLQRWRCTLVVTIVCVEDLPILTAHKENSALQGFLQKIVSLGKECLKEVGALRSETSRLMGKVKQRYQQWGKLLMTKGEFRVERRHSKTPMYSKKRMPESVTIYENDFEPFLSHDASIIDGKVLLYRSDGELDVMIELKSSSELISRTQDDLQASELFCLIEALLSHSQQLVLCAKSRVTKATTSLGHNIFDQEYGLLKDRVTNFEFDSYFDPICALEFKTTLAEVVNRKEELLNTVEHLAKGVVFMEAILKYFIKYVRQVGKKRSGSLIRACTCRATSQKIYGKLDNLQNEDFMITIPLREQLLRDFCHMEVKKSEISIPSKDNEFDNDHRGHNEPEHKRDSK